MRAGIQASGVVGLTVAVAALAAALAFGAGASVGRAAEGGRADSCLKPLIPACMDDSTTFVSANLMESCQFEVRDYIERTMTYLSCLNVDVAETGNELTRNVERFNCRLQGGQACY